MKKPAPHRVAFPACMLVFSLSMLATLRAHGQLDDLQTGSALVILLTLATVGVLARRFFAQFPAHFNGSLASLSPLIGGRVAPGIRLLAGILVALMIFIAATLGWGWLHGMAFEWPGTGNLLFAGLFLWMCAAVAVHGHPPLLIQRLLMPGGRQDRQP
jgi:hypothetical protein